MASAEEVRGVTGCVPGAVPPFGSLWAARGVAVTVVDESLREQGPTVNFNAGLRTHSVGMATADYYAVEQPLAARFSAP